MSFILNLMVDILGKSKQLLLLAESSKWDEFSILDAERQALLLKFDIENIEMSEQDGEFLYEQISKMLALNEELEVLCLSQRDTVVEELQTLRKGNKVAQVYSQLSPRKSA